MKTIFLRNVVLMYLMLSPIASYAITIIPPSPRDQVYSEIGRSFGEGFSKGFSEARQKDKKTITNQNQNAQGRTVALQTILELFCSNKFDECFILCESILSDRSNRDDVFAIRSIMARCPTTPQLREKAALNADTIIKNASLVEPLTLGFAWCHKCSYALTQEKNEDCLKYAEIALVILDSIKKDDDFKDVFKSSVHFFKFCAYDKLGLKEEASAEFSLYQKESDW